MNEENQEVVTIPQQTNTFLPMGEEAQMIGQWAAMVATSPYYAKEGGKPGIVSKWLAAKELGLAPMAALNGGLYYVQGQICISATAMNALIRKRGHSIQKVQHNDTLCELKGTRKDNGDTANSIFTIEQAKKAGLIKGGSPWEKYPSRMLFNRALSNLAKDLFPDCIQGVEVDADFDEIEIIEEPKEAPLERETAKFIDKHNLLDEGSELSQFIDRIALTLDKKRIDIIADAAKDEEKFLLSFENYKKKKK